MCERGLRGMYEGYVIGVCERGVRVVCERGV